MDIPNTSGSHLHGLVYGKYEEAKSLLESIDEDAADLVVDIRLFRDLLIELEALRSELGLLAEQR